MKTILKFSIVILLLAEICCLLSCHKEFVLLNLPSNQAPESNDETHQSINCPGADIIITLPLDSIYLGWWSTWPSGNYEWLQLAGPSAATVIDSAFVPLISPNISLVKQLIAGYYSFQLIQINTAPVSLDTINIVVINNPKEQNTITFKNLKWDLRDEYGLGLLDLSLSLPILPNLFIESFPGSWQTGHWKPVPFGLYLQIDSSSQWIEVNKHSQQGIRSQYFYDTNCPVAWIMQYPIDVTRKGKVSSAKIKFYN